MNTIKELRKNRGISQAELAEICSVHQTAVSQWENGHTTPDTETLALLSEFFNVSIEYILGKQVKPGKYMIPVLGYVRAGIPIEAVEEILDYEEITPKMASAGEHFGLKISGDSMMPRFYPGDVVIVRKQSDVSNGDIAVVLVNGCDATVKKILKKGDSIMLVPLNTDYEPIVYSKKEIEELPVNIIGKVVELRGKFY